MAFIVVGLALCGFIVLDSFERWFFHRKEEEKTVCAFAASLKPKTKHIATICNVLTQHIAKYTKKKTMKWNDKKTNTANLTDEAQNKAHRIGEHKKK